MTYIKNKSKEKIVIRDFINNKEVILKFSPKSVTAVDSDLETSFKEVSTVYTKQFTQGTFVYTSRPSEMYVDDFTHYLKKFYFDSETEELTFVFDEVLIGEDIDIKFSVDGNLNIEEASFTLDNTAKATIQVGTVENFVEFRLYNDIYSDFPIAYSPRIKAYK